MTFDNPADALEKARELAAQNPDSPRLDVPERADGQ
jgi:hypothetical protein